MPESTQPLDQGVNRGRQAAARAPKHLGARFLAPAACGWAHAQPRPVIETYMLAIGRARQGLAYWVPQPAGNPPYHLDNQLAVVRHSPRLPAFPTARFGGVPIGHHEVETVPLYQHHPLPRLRSHKCAPSIGQQAIVHQAKAEFHGIFEILRREE